MNTSQFLITLQCAEYLDKRNTIFGEVDANTLLNVFRMNELDIDNNDRPVDPPHIIRIDLLESFDGITILFVSIKKHLVLKIIANCDILKKKFNKEFFLLVNENCYDLKKIKNKTLTDSILISKVTHQYSKKRLNEKTVNSIRKSLSFKHSFYHDSIASL